MRCIPPLLLLLSGGAQANDCVSPDPTTAEVNAREGVRLAKQGRFNEAAALLGIAVRLDPCAPDHHLLLARAQARMGDGAAARKGYSLVLERFPGTPSAELAKAELADLQQPEPEATKAAEPPREATPPVVRQQTETTPPPGDAPPWRVLGLSTAGAGAVMLGVGVFFAMDASDADEGLESGPTTRARYDELVDQREGSSTLAYTFYALGGVCVVAGAVMAFVLPEEAPRTSSAAVGPNGIVLHF